MRKSARRVLAGYLTAPVYRVFQEWLGRGEALTKMWELWDAATVSTSHEAALRLSPAGG